jgi:hypothetical protein
MEHTPHLLELFESLGRMRTLRNLNISNNFSDCQTTLDPLFISIATSTICVLHLDRIVFSPKNYGDISIFSSLFSGPVKELTLNYSSLYVKDHGAKREFLEILRESNLEKLQLNSFIFGGSDHVRSDLSVLCATSEMRSLKVFEAGNSHAMLAKRKPFDHLADNEMTEEQVFFLAFERFKNLEFFSMDLRSERLSLRRKVDTFSEMIQRRTLARRQAWCFLHCFLALALPRGTIPVLVDGAAVAVHLGALPTGVAQQTFRLIAGSYWDSEEGEDPSDSSYSSGDSGDSGDSSSSSGDSEYSSYSSENFSDFPEEDEDLAVEEESNRRLKRGATDNPESDDDELEQKRARTASPQP